MVRNSNDETNYSHKLLLTVHKFQGYVTHLQSVHQLVKKSPKNELSKRVQLGRFWGSRLGPLIRTDQLLIEYVLKQLPKSVLMPLGSTEAASAVDESIQKKVFGSGTTILIFSSEEWDDTIKI